MKTIPEQPKEKIRGSVLMVALVLMMLASVGVVGMLQLSTFQLRAENGRWQASQAYHHAENALHLATQYIADSDSDGAAATFLGDYNVHAGEFNMGEQVNYMIRLAQSADSRFEAAWVTIANDPLAGRNKYQVTASAKVGDKVRTIQTIVHKNPPSEVFDYEYFINNWGWWWGGNITGWGNNRANWDFDFRRNPSVNGHVSANGAITDSGTPYDPLSGLAAPFDGLAGDTPIDYIHSGVGRLSMPNLADLSYYMQKAVEESGQLFVGDEEKIQAVHSHSTQTGIYLAGTDEAPIRIHGPVVIPGDVILKGKITGVGTLYVGGNLYITGDIDYVNGPSFDPPPASLNQAGRDLWVRDAIADEKDLIAFAVRGTIFAGDVNSRSWESQCGNNPNYGLIHIGNESQLGADGIANTPDDGVPWRDTNNDGIPDTAWYDADGDGVMDGNYNYQTDIRMTDARRGLIFDFPENNDGTLMDFGDTVDDRMNHLSGIYYTNHALALQMQRPHMEIRGSVICRDEAIIFSGSAQYLYDYRSHSRYNNDTNRFIDLQLPVARAVSITRYEEIAPVEGFYRGS